MRLICGPDTLEIPNAGGALRIHLYGAPAEGQAAAGRAVLREVRRRRLEVAPRAWDLLSIALSAVSADFAELRDSSPDGWTREFELDVAVTDPAFWNGQADALSATLAFLTTDRWAFRFHEGGLPPHVPEDPVHPEEDSVVLLSGGLDSLVGALDLAASGRAPLAVSQTVRGDASKQEEFASMIGGGLTHLQLNHTAISPGVDEPSQRARSLIFIAYGVLAATALGRYHDGGDVPLFVCENGFIAINVPLTGGRLGSLSTRTAHPEFLGRLQGVLDAADLRVGIENPYGSATKGEMLRDCQDQSLLAREASRSTSCGRFQRHGYTHCGRCVPCQVRRAAFLAWGEPDDTEYVFEALGQQDGDHAQFGDVRAVALALATVRAEGLDTWLGPSLSSPMITNRESLRAMIERGLEELRALHESYGVT